MNLIVINNFSIITSVFNLKQNESFVLFGDMRVGNDKA